MNWPEAFAITVPVACILVICVISLYLESKKDSDE